MLTAPFSDLESRKSKKEPGERAEVALGARDPPVIGVVGTSGVLEGGASAGVGVRSLSEAAPLLLLSGTKMTCELGGVSMLSPPALSSELA